MLETFFILIFIGIVFGFIFLKGNAFKSEGQTQGICVEVKVEFNNNDGSPYNEQLRGSNSRMYRPYIRYNWQGKEYVAKSFRAYSQAKVFPGDKLEIMVSVSDKEVVKIV